MRGWHLGVQVSGGEFEKKDGSFVGGGEAFELPPGAGKSLRVSTEEAPDKLSEGALPFDPARGDDFAALVEEHIVGARESDGLQPEFVNRANPDLGACDEVGRERNRGSLAGVNPDDEFFGHRNIIAGCLRGLVRPGDRQRLCE